MYFIRNISIRIENVLLHVDDLGSQAWLSSMTLRLCMTLLKCRLNRSSGSSQSTRISTIESVWFLKRFLKKQFQERLEMFVACRSFGVSVLSLDSSPASLWIAWWGGAKSNTLVLSQCNWLNDFWKRPLVTSSGSRSILLHCGVSDIFLAFSLSCLILISSSQNAI